MVGLENTTYQVTEDVGVVEICAVVFSDHDICSLPVPLQVSLSTTDKTAGIVVSLLILSAHAGKLRYLVCVCVCVFVFVCICLSDFCLLLYFSEAANLYDEMTQSMTQSNLL